MISHYSKFFQKYINMIGYLNIFDGRFYNTIKCHLLKTMQLPGKVLVLYYRASCAGVYYMDC